MSKITNNPALGDWDELEKEIFTPEEIAESKMRVALTWELIKACKEGKITEKELDEIEDIEEPELWLDAIVKKLISLGKTLKVVPIEQESAEQISVEQDRVEQDKAS